MWYFIFLQKKWAIFDLFTIFKARGVKVELEPRRIHRNLFFKQKKNNILWLCFVLKSDLKILFVCLFEIFVWMFCIRFSFEIFLIFLMFCFHWYFDTLCYMCLIFLFDIFVLYFVWDFFFRFWFSLVDISWSNI